MSYARTFAMDSITSFFSKNMIEGIIVVVIGGIALALLTRTNQWAWERFGKPLCLRAMHSMWPRIKAPFSKLANHPNLPVVIRRSLYMEFLATTNEVSHMKGKTDLLMMENKVLNAQIEGLEDRLRQVEEECKTHLPTNIGLATAATGQTCLLPGIWRAGCQCESEIAMSKGQRFPPCTQHGAVTWLSVTINQNP